MSSNLVILPHALTGTVSAVASKSVAHRLIVLAAITDAITEIDCTTTSQDIEATLACVEALGAIVSRTRLGFRIVGIPATAKRGIRPARDTLDCGESGSTLRFLLPVVAALGMPVSFTGHGRLAQRPLSPLYEQLIEHGVSLSQQRTFPLELSGKLTGGVFTLPGNVSSQYVSGLLMAAPLVDGPVSILVAKPVESMPYIMLTIRALAAFGVPVAQSNVDQDGTSFLRLDVGEGPLVSPEAIQVEGDWSNAAFWLAAGALSQGGIEVTALDGTSVQGDRAILAALALLGARISRTRGSAAATYDHLNGIDLDVSNIPDLVPPLAAVASCAQGETRLRNAARLRLKESDRLLTVSNAINAIGGDACIDDDDLVIRGGALTGGIVDAAGDHRIAMMAAVMATHAQGPVMLLGADCVAKSYPAFWDHYISLGGIISSLEE
ncbi:MAG: 3-phosphoshikimate 1-carboxyvinyltransferase [Atopobiaceae bacterium]|nr:3-phosphoshikimate 1-carboxyvinyltransferase [Atopobiaceae bacterium]